MTSYHVTHDHPKPVTVNVGLPLISCLGTTPSVPFFGRQKTVIPLTDTLSGRPSIRDGVVHFSTQYCDSNILRLQQTVQF
jgi:hypothetical protein